MNVFSVKLIGLYSLAIGGAVGLFQLITSYGETHLQAPIAVTGNYLITAKNLPGCLQNQSLLLNLKQSGVYLNASLSAIQTPDRADIFKTIEKFQISTSGDIRPTFSGRLADRQFNLTGLISAKNCPKSSQLQLVGSFLDRLTPKLPQQLRGELSLITPANDRLPPVEFVGISPPLKRSIVAD